METGLFGKPKQGYGFSNNPSSTFGPPGFDSAAFTYKGGTLHLPVRRFGKRGTADLRHGLLLAACEDGEGRKSAPGCDLIETSGKIAKADG